MLTEQWKDWLARYSTAFQTTDPRDQFSEAERICLSRILQAAEVIGLGEMTHGSREIFRAKDRLLRELVRQHGVTVIVLESNFAATCDLNEFVIDGQGDSLSALVATGFWSCANDETLEFVNWLAEHNASVTADKKVKVYGCDVQSLDDCKRMLTRILRAASQQRTVAREAAENAIQRVAELPGDGEMFARVKPLLAELDAKHPHLERLADLQGKQSEFIAAARQQVRDIVGLLNDVETELSGKATPDDCFLFGRCVRSIEMCLDTLDFDKGWRARDRHMAEHVSCICRRHPGERVVLTSGNWHIARVPIELSGMADYVTMGSLLAEKLGDKYRTLGSAFHGGRYLGVAGIGSSTEDIVVETHVPRPDTWEYFWNLHARDSAAPAPGFLVDFRAARSSDEESPWPPGLKMNIGEARASQPYEATFVSQRPDLQYDAMLFLIESTPLTVLPQYYLVSRQKWGAPSDS